MYTKKLLVGLLIIFISNLSLNAQSKTFKKLNTTAQKGSTVKKEYPFNPDYPGIYSNGGQLFLEHVYYKRNANLTTFKSKYLIIFSGMSKGGYFYSNLGFNNLDEFIYYQDIIENKKYKKIILSNDKKSGLGEIIVFQHSKRDFPKV